MKGHFLNLALLLGLGGHSFFAPPVVPQDSRSDCPRVEVECPEDDREDTLTFRVRLRGGQAPPKLTYKWRVSGGEIKEGQGTPCVVITNVDLSKETLHVIVDVGGLPDGCGGNAACSMAG